MKNNQTSNKYFKVFIGTDIYENDFIKSNDDSQCIIRFNDDKTHLFIEPKTIISLDDDNFSRSIDLILVAVLICGSIQVLIVKIKSSVHIPNRSYYNL